MTKKQRFLTKTLHSFLIPSDYSEFFQELQSRIQTAQIKASALVNLELTTLYWDIGQKLSKKTD
ncbi:hypothetical protein [Candidatus Rhabdochlamydia porcellionis]|jgi:hypothetical protein|uniref:Cytoplasmic protein n=1 Tax=Candidatus Rhabdochlamydia porcellionis TaxID=225148 RepID=A0ABX8Z0E7_9BACT|nr:hypothetical protein [Candidatus Rhabdochlamydia porcellionis]QZA59112.1 hypothetical protein RHAB15C_0000996 [Candidatus Rhabdochlamydia porcellionis]